MPFGNLIHFQTENTLLAKDGLHFLCEGVIASGADLHAWRKLLILEQVLLQAQKLQDTPNSSLWILHKILEVNEHHAAQQDNIH